MTEAEASSFFFLILFFFRQPCYGKQKNCRHNDYIEPQSFFLSSISCKLTLIHVFKKKLILHVYFFIILNMIRFFYLRNKDSKKKNREQKRENP